MSYPTQYHIPILYHRLTITIEIIRTSTYLAIHTLHRSHGKCATIKQIPLEQEFIISVYLCVQRGGSADTPCPYPGNVKFKIREQGNGNVSICGANCTRSLAQSRRRRGAHANAPASGRGPISCPVAIIPNLRQIL